MAPGKTASFFLWINKLFECFVVYIFLRDLSYTYLPFDLYIFDSVSIYFGSLFTGWNFPLAIITIAFSLWWQRAENKRHTAFPALHEWLRSIMCYYTSFLILQYGLQKIFNNQFHHNFYRDDTLAGNLTGFAVAWNFFSYSLYYTVIVGALQIAGGILLLFKKTRIIGSIILLPVMINIFFINQFYGVSADAYVNCLFILITAAYMLWLKRDEVLLFFSNKNFLSSPKKAIYIKNILRIVLVIFAFTANYPYRQIREGAYYIGKWKVIKLLKNNQLKDLEKWQSDSSIWNNVYVETNGRIAFSANPFYYDYSGNRTTNFHFKPIDNGIVLMKHTPGEPPQSVPVHIKQNSPSLMQWDMIMQKDSIKMLLAKDTLKKLIEDKDLR